LAAGSKFFVGHKKLRFANAKRSHGFYSSNGGITNFILECVRKWDTF
jgi:hypothetical protein